LVLGYLVYCVFGSVGMFASSRYWLGLDGSPNMSTRESSGLLELVREGLTDLTNSALRAFSAQRT